MIEKYPHKYCLQDEYGYTDKDLVDKLNEVIEAVNTIAYKNNECSNDCRTANQTNADRIRNMSDEKLAEFIQEMKNTCLVDFMGYADKNCEPFCEQDKISCKDCQAKAPTILEWLQSEAE